MTDKLGVYADLGIDRVILNVNFGVDANASARVTPHSTPLSIDCRSIAEFRVVHSVQETHVFARRVTVSANMV